MTRDACVRLWELDSENRASFDQPALAIDLKKLANATSNQADLSASKFGTNKGFSPDQVEMEVAAACFGGQGSEEEHGWASMTLWVAMSEGDVYALCPFLPEKWAAPATLLPSLSTSVTERSRAMQRDAEATESERRAVDQQCKWLAEVDAQEPHLLPGKEEFETVEVYTRPLTLSSVPKLQGPFQLTPEPDFGEITDIHVVAPKLDSDALYDEDYDDVGGDEGLSVSVICLATTTNEVHVCLDLDGVEAVWLPSKRSRAYTFDDVEDEKELVLLETIDLAASDAEDNGWPTFTPSPSDRYELFVTRPTGVCTLNFRPWIGPLEDELSTPSDSGVRTRLSVALDSTSTLVNIPIQITSASSSPEGNKLNTAIAILEPGTGYVLLTSTQSHIPYATEIDIPTLSPHSFEPDLYPAAAGLLPAPEPRAPYRPDPAFDQPSHLPQLLKTAHTSNLLAAADLKHQIRFSPATLQLMTSAHQVLSSEWYRLNVAAADLFRRCERMRVELGEQVRRVGEVAGRIDALAGRDGDGDGGEGEGKGEEGASAGKEKLEARVERTSERGRVLASRLEGLRRRMVGLGGRAMSTREKAFAKEIERLEGSLLRSSTQDRRQGDAAAGAGEVESFTSSQSMASPPASGSSGATALAKRFDEVLQLSNDLRAQAKRVAADSADKEGEEKASRPQSRSSIGGGGVGSGVGLGGKFRRERLDRVFALLERETALVEAVGVRLGRLERGG